MGCLTSTNTGLSTTKISTNHNKFVDKGKRIDWTSITTELKQFPEASSDINIYHFNENNVLLIHQAKFFLFNTKTQIYKQITTHPRYESAVEVNDDTQAWNIGIINITNYECNPSPNKYHFVTYSILQFANDILRHELIINCKNKEHVECEWMESDHILTNNQYLIGRAFYDPYNKHLLYKYCPDSNRDNHGLLIYNLKDDKVIDLTRSLQSDANFDGTSYTCINIGDKTFCVFGRNLVHTTPEIWKYNDRQKKIEVKYMRLIESNSSNKYGSRYLKYLDYIIEFVFNGSAQEYEIWIYEFNNDKWYQTNIKVGPGLKIKAMFMHLDGFIYITLTLYDPQSHLPDEVNGKLYKMEARLLLENVNVFYLDDIKAAKITDYWVRELEVDDKWIISLTQIVINFM